jgi:hypothetical protein
MTYRYMLSPEVPRPRFLVPNKKVAAEPFPAAGQQARVVKGVVQPMNQSVLVPLKVVFQSGEFAPGWTVYVRTKLRDSSLIGKEVFEAGGQPFILVPEEEVVLVDTQAESADSQATPPGA